MLKYDADAAEAGSAEERTLGSGVVLRLRGVAEGLEPGFALPLLLTEGAMVVLATVDVGAGICGERGRAVDAGKVCATGIRNAHNRQTCDCRAVSVEQSSMRVRWANEGAVVTCVRYSAYIVSACLSADPAKQTSTVPWLTDEMLDTELG